MIQRALIHIFLILSLLCGARAVFAATTEVTPIVPPTSGKWTITDYTNTKINPKLAVIESNRQDIETSKAAKTEVVRYWSSWPDASPGNTIEVNTIVAYEGKLYTCTQEFVKTAGATPIAFTSYFSEVTGSGGSYTLPTASAETLGGIKVGSRLTITDGVLSADVQTTDMSGKEDSLGNPSTNGYVLSSTTAGVRSWIENGSGGSMTWPAAAGVTVYGGSSAWGSSLTLDTDLSSVSASDDSLPSAKATKTALDLKANVSGISFVVAALSDLKYDPDTGTADDEYNLITNTGSVGDANDATVVPTLERVGALFSFASHNHTGVYEPADATILKYADIGSTVQAYDADLTKDAIVFHFYNAGSALAANQTANTKVPIPWNATITKASVVCENSGSIVIDVWKDSYANYPPTVADTITASTKPTTSSAIKSQDTTLTGWTTALSVGDILKANIDSNATHTDCTLTLEVTK